MSMILMTSCGASGERETRTSFISPSADGSMVAAENNATIDYSNAQNGYIMVKYTGSSPKIKIQITGPGGVTYIYTSFSGEYETFPITEGSGIYKIGVFEHISNNLYSVLMTKTINVNIEDEFGAFLYPNQYVWYTEDSDVIKLGKKLSDKSDSDIDYVENVYNYVIKNIKYDDALATDVPVDYIPDIDATLKSGKGICFDYVSVMSALLRSQGVPTKLVVGYSGVEYHAWISVYLEEQGWVDNIIEFNGKSWSLMDPTLASSNDDKSVKEYLSDNSNYVAKFFY